MRESTRSEREKKAADAARKKEEEAKQKQAILAAAELFGDAVLDNRDPATVDLAAAVASPEQDSREKRRMERRRQREERRLQFEKEKEERQARLEAGEAEEDEMPERDAGTREPVDVEKMMEERRKVTRTCWWR